MHLAGPRSYREHEPSTLLGDSRAGCRDTQLRGACIHAAHAGNDVRQRALSRPDMDTYDSADHAGMEEGLDADTG